MYVHCEIGLSLEKWPADSEHCALKARKVIEHLRQALRIHAMYTLIFSQLANLAPVIQSE
jgi:hypothetical protein